MIEERLNKLAHDPELGMGGPMPMATPDPVQHLGRLRRMADEESLFAALNAGADAGRACADAVDMARRYSEFNRIKDMGEARA